MKTYFEIEWRGDPDSAPSADEISSLLSCPDARVRKVWTSPVRDSEKRQELTEEMVDRFLSWPLPASVRSDECVTMTNYPFLRTGTNLLTVVEARQMLEHVFGISRTAVAK